MSGFCLQDGSSQVQGKGQGLQSVSGEQIKAEREVLERCQKSQPDKRVCVVK